MANNKIQNSEFKLGKSVLILFLFQILISIAVSASFYVLTDLIKLLPTSNHSLEMVGTIMGSLYFGQWMEKRYPGMLDKKRIKKLSLLCCMINGILALLISSALLYSDNNIGKSFALSGLGIAVAFILFIMMILYFAIKFFISCGIKTRRRRKVKLQLEN